MKMNDTYPFKEFQEMVRQVLAGAEAGPAVAHLESLEERLVGVLENDLPRALGDGLFDLAESVGEEARRLGFFLRKHSTLDLEHRVWEAHCKLILAAFVHRREVTGPALIELADCCDRFGKTEQSQQIYSQIVSDFQQILAWGPNFDPGWLKAVACLNQALQRTETGFGRLAERTQHVLEEGYKLREQQKLSVEAHHAIEGLRCASGRSVSSSAYLKEP